MKYFLQAKLGMSESFTLIGEYPTLREAVVAQQEYTYHQLCGDLYAESNIIKEEDLIK